MFVLRVLIIHFLDECVTEPLAATTELQTSCINIRSLTTGSHVRILPHILSFGQNVTDPNYELKPATLICS